MSETKFEASAVAGCIKIVSTQTSNDSVTITTKDTNKYTFLATLNAEKVRNLAQIATLTERNAKIDTDTAYILSLA
jgi:hypothetical protein